MASLNEKHLDLYVQGMNTSVFHKWYNANGWSDWAKLDGTTTRYDPVVVTRPKNGRCIDIFIVGFDHCLYHRMWKSAGGWTAWEKIGTQCLGPPAVVSRDQDKFLEIVYVGTDHSLKHKRMEAEQKWVPAGTETMDWGGKYLYNRGSACSWGENHVSFFHIGMDSKCYEKRWVKGVTGWNDFEVPGTWACPPRALSQYEGKMAVAGLNDESKLFCCEYYRPKGETWSHDVFTDGIYSKEIPEFACFGKGEDRMDIFAVGLDSAVYQKSWKKGTGWQALKKLGGCTVYAPRAVSWGGTRYDLCSVGVDFALWHIWTDDGDNWKPSPAKWESLGGTMPSMCGGKV
ncbi:hypothetical protein ABW20_dc0105788 [Dactylellina cionopaga]|nr:hypothetical protein ABW20_dc0105788 [Dactylellina cionopaga]